MSEIYQKDGEWFFDSYFDFIESNSHNIPKGIRDLVLNPNRYIFNRKETLHDSWFIKMIYNSDFSKGTLNCSIFFLNPYHDKIYEFQFFDIKKIKIPKKSIFKEDLLVHQFNFYKSYFRYDFLFSNDTMISVFFKDAIFKEDKVCNLGNVSDVGNV